MNPAAPYRGTGKKLGEVSLWTGASVLVLTAHIAAAALLMQEEPVVEADSAPPAAIMIEMAAEPEAVNTEEEQISQDVADSEKVESEQPEPVEEAQPEPTPEPVEPPPEEVAEEPPPPPEPEIAEPLPEPPPEPIEEPDPIEQQITAALENVEVPLPTVRPPPPPPEVAKKPEPKKEPVKRVERRKQQQAREEMAQAKAQVTQSNRNAARQSSAGSAFSANVSPARWMTRVRAKIARNARRCPGNGTGIVTVRFSFDGSGNIGSVSVARSSGDSAIDSYVTSAVRRASPIPAPPAGVASSLSQPVKCE
jgi:periplasmic protein TonB